MHIQSDSLTYPSHQKNSNSQVYYWYIKGFGASNTTGRSRNEGGGVTLIKSAVTAATTFFFDQQFSAAPF